ncbi:MAG: SCO1664 family protein [Acidimicrobiia bacterium]|nr:SCO1664 family protein [Acidimicrobiia bacterium]
MSETAPVRVEEVIGRFSAASNLTLLARAGGELVVYKPAAGTRPLWDFAALTLADREVLTHRVDEAMGLGIVPQTRRGDGPLGPGAVQRYVEPDPEFDPLPLIAEAHPVLWPVAVLDLVTNNADRKAGHVLREAGTGRLWAIDHGLTFHPEPKLRTVLWGFAGRELPAAVVAGLASLEQALAAGLREEVAAALGPAAGEALYRRVRALRRRPCHPAPPRDRRPLPWPPY